MAIDRDSEHKKLSTAMNRIKDYCGVVKREQVNYSTFNIGILYEVVDMIIVEAHKMDSIGDRLADLREEA